MESKGKNRNDCIDFAAWLLFLTLDFSGELIWLILNLTT